MAVVELEGASHLHTERLKRLQAQQQVRNRLQVDLQQVVEKGTCLS